MSDNSDPRILVGSCLDRLKELPDNSIDAVVTDPPYGLANTTPQQVADTLVKWATGERDFIPEGHGFMGKRWDAFVPPPAVWDEVKRVLKPGGHVLAFAGSRTGDLMSMGLRLAGFDIRDTITWHYGSGFPKSLDVSKAIDKNNGEGDRALRFTQWMRTAGLTRSQATSLLRDAEMISLNGTMAGHFFANSQSGQPAVPTAAMWAVLRPHCGDVPTWVDEFVQRVEAEREVIGQRTTGIGTGKGTTAYITDSDNRDVTAPATDAARQWEGWGTALKPASEPIIVARKPLEGTVASSVLTYGTGALNIDATRVGTDGGGTNCGNRDEQGACKGHATANGSLGGGVMRHAAETTSGRWPANVVFTHSPECDAECSEGCPVRELDEQSGVLKSGATSPSQNRKGLISNSMSGAVSADRVKNEFPADSGGASRFFPTFRYQAKPSKAERNAGLDHLEGGNNHPTVKPTELFRWLLKLVVPPGGTVLDPFLGSGTTAVAAILEGFDWKGCELTPDYIPIIAGRVAWAEAEVKKPATPAKAKKPRAKKVKPEAPKQGEQLGLFED